MLGRIGVWRHLVALGSVVGTTVLAATGVIGSGNHDERFDSKVVTVQPVGTDGLRIGEVVDEDFGSKDRHGYQRIIPIDFGEPTDLEASSPDADATINLDSVGSQLRIRLGDANKTLSGQHRYVLAYTLPSAQLSTGQLALDIIGTDETLETGRFEVVVTGLELDNPTCNVGTGGTSGGCTLARDGDVYRTVISPLKPGQGITIGGTIAGRLPVVGVADPPIPKRRSDDRLLLALAMIPLGLIAVGIVFVSARRRGSNEVFAGGAADAAYGSLPNPSGAAPPRADVRMVPDSKMGELATIEFVPPKGIEPWQGAVLLSERFDRTTVAAWVSGLVAKDAITLTQEDDELVIHRGPKHDQLDADAKALVDQMLDYKEELKLGTYNANFGKAWSQVWTLERDGIAKSGWWKRLPPGSARQGGAATKFVGLVVVAFFVFGAGSLVSALLGTFRGKIAAVIFAVLVPYFFAHFVYSVLLPARSATGSALALRAESFRRFLAASEGKHVDWAWKQGLLREYSAWAVALGAADAWGRALATSNVPAVEMSLASPIWLYSMGPSFESTRSAPSSSGSSGSGFSGFSGGSVGGGGGGGSSGSW
ncbi:MAG: DUF2207 domain-containing protein [Ilumatobacteraceae bacterium]|nr:DUF2207 domain-containing protein [Ilumatobacteraceae bacterium]